MDIKTAEQGTTYSVGDAVKFRVVKYNGKGERLEDTGEVITGTIWHVKPGDYFVVKPSVHRINAEKSLPYLVHIDDIITPYANVLYQNLI